jgi:hypothetical protein
MRTLAALADVGKTTVARAEDASDAGDRNALRGPTWKALADALSRASGERVHLDDIRPAARDHA